MQAATHIPIEQRGKIGAAAASLGLGHKVESDPYQKSKIFDLPDTFLIPLPQKPHDSWEQDIVSKLERLSCRLADVGRTQHGNLLRDNLTKPRSDYFHIDRVTGMVEAIEKFEAARADKLEPIPDPKQFATIEDIDLIVEDSAFAPGCLPDAIASQIVCELNSLFRFLGHKGYRTPYETTVLQAPQEIRDRAQCYSKICGAAVRFINQLHYLRTASRKGGSRHNLMTFGRRLKLVDQALQQLATYCNAAEWSLAGFKLVTAEIKAKWEARQETDPLPGYFARNLFEYAAPDPCNLSDAQLDNTIQQHPDMDYVEACRDEKRRRTLA